MKEMSFRVATSWNVVAKAILSNCSLNENEFTSPSIEFASAEVAEAMYNALKDAGYDVSVLELENNYINVQPFIGITVQHSKEYCAIEICWLEESFHHVQCAEGVGCWLRKPRTRRINLEKN